MRHSVLFLIVVVWVALSSTVSSRAQSTRAQQPAPTANGAMVAKGQAWFYQRCALCHLGRIIKDEKFKPMGPSLAGLFKDAPPTFEEDVREIIKTGTVSERPPLRMPGFRYGLTAQELDELIAYLKTL